MQSAGADILNVDFPSAKEIIPPKGWDWSYAAGESGSRLSEFEVVKLEFYRSLQDCQRALRGTQGDMNSLEDVAAYNIRHTSSEGGVLGTHPA